MNTFVLDKSPAKSAEYHCDKHVVKMILESGQMMCAAHWLHLLKAHYPGDITDFKRVKDIQSWLRSNTPVKDQPPWSLSHMRHPCTIWTSETYENYMWQYELGISLCKEYTKRYGRVHASEIVIKWLGDNLPINIDRKKGLTPFVICMKEEYKISKDPVQCYRNYYLKDKIRFAKWKLNNEPYWWIKGVKNGKT